MAHARGEYADKLKKTRPEIFRPVDALRWQRGKSPAVDRFMLFMLAMLQLAVVGALLVWNLMNPSKADWWPACSMLLASGFPFWLLLVNRRLELVVSDTELRLRHPWRWLDRRLGWRVPLATLANQATWAFDTPLRQDRLMQVALTWGNHAWTQSPWRKGTLLVSGWAPWRAGQLQPGPWPAPKRAPNGVQRFFMRPTPFTESEAQDLSNRLQHLPLVQALCTRGVVLPSLPGPDQLPGRAASMGMLDLRQVPEMRRGLWLLGVLAVLGFALAAAPMRWRFVTIPWSLYGGGSLLGVLLCWWLLWPRKSVRQAGLAEGAATAQARSTAVFLALLCGPLLIWAGAHGLLWWSAHTQTSSTMTFVLDKSTIDPGPVRLTSKQTGAVQVIEWDTLLRFWQNEPDGQRYDIAIFPSAIGPWWMFDNTPIRKRSEAFYRRESSSRTATSSATQ